MKIDEIRGKTDGELEFEVANMRRELFDLRFKSATQAIQSPSRMRALKRDIARILTISKERQVGLRGQKSR
jgi:large subunit ribosomal protein L29